MNNVDACPYSVSERRDSPHTFTVSKNKLGVKTNSLGYYLI